MNKLVLSLFVALALLSCKKSGENIVWERTYGKGKALCVRNTADTGIVSCGQLEGNQYLMLTDLNGTRTLEYKPSKQGALTAVIPATGCFIAAGVTEGKMEISRIGTSGQADWDTTFTTSFTVDHTALCDMGNGSYLAVGSADPDSAKREITGLSLIVIDADGSISFRQDSVYSSYIAVRSVATDASGNLYMAMTRIGTGGKMKASVVKYNQDFQKIYEKELYNNPAYSAASQGITVDDEGNPLVSGRTELSINTGTADNAFAAKYFFKGDSLQKQYLEFRNSGTEVKSDGAGQFIVLNKNCLIVDFLGERTKISGIVRMFSSCDSKTTDAFGQSIDLISSGNFVIAGSKSNYYYLAVKSSSALSPV